MLPPTIDLTSIRLRALRPEDAAAWHAYLSDPLVTELTSYPIMSLADVESMIGRCLAGYDAGTSCTWAVTPKADDVLVGTCGFNKLRASEGWAELAYDLARSYWGHGFITQAAKACLGWAFAQPGLDRVHAFVMVGNGRSEGVLERAGFAREAYLPAHRIARGEPRDYWQFTLLRANWKKADEGKMG